LPAEAGSLERRLRQFAQQGEIGVAALLQVIEAPHEEIEQPVLGVALQRVGFQRTQDVIVGFPCQASSRAPLVG